MADISSLADGPSKYLEGLYVDDSGILGVRQELAARSAWKPADLQTLSARSHRE